MWYRFSCSSIYGRFLLRHSYVKQYNFNNIKILSSLTLFKYILPFIFYFLYFACKVRGGLLSPDLNSIIKTFFISFFFITEFEMKTSQPKRRLALSMRKQEIFIFSVSVCLSSLMRHDKQNIHGCWRHSFNCFNLTRTFQFSGVL